MRIILGSSYRRSWDLLSCLWSIPIIRFDVVDRGWNDRRWLISEILERVFDRLCGSTS
jgi:hypothetical protein